MSVSLEFIEALYAKAYSKLLVDHSMSASLFKHADELLVKYASERNWVNPFEQSDVLHERFDFLLLSMDYDAASRRRKSA